MARYATTEEQYQCRYCSYYFVFSDLKRNGSTIICPNCISNMGSFGVQIYSDLYTIGYIDSDPPVQHNWSREQIENLEEIDIMKYLYGIDREGIE